MTLYSLALKLGVASLAAGLLAGSSLGLTASLGLAAARGAPPGADETVKDSKGDKTAEAPKGDKKDAGAQDSPKPGDTKAPPRRPAAGKRTEEALADRLLKEHPEADTNKDGKVSADELRAWRREHPAVPQGRRLEEFLKNHPEADKDKDGKISTEEMREFLKASPPLPQGKRLEQLPKKHPEPDRDKD